ncbi:hypothetical protein GCM10009347_40750 [Shewanella algicola]|nr:hypothetical protein GCM10009347_40750 [Shewanella algicola]
MLSNPSGQLDLAISVSFTHFERSDVLVQLELGHVYKRLAVFTFWQVFVVESKIYESGHISAVIFGTSSE